MRDNCAENQTPQIGQREGKIERGKDKRQLGIPAKLKKAVTGFPN